MKRLLVVGTQPNARGNGQPLAGRSGLRLSRLMDAPLFEVAHTANMFERWETVTLDCRDRAREMLNWAWRNDVDRVVFLINPKRAGIPCGYFEWFPLQLPLGDLEVAFSPHPSGRNHWWNDPENLKQATLFWSDLGEWAHAVHQRTEPDPAPDRSVPNGHVRLAEAPE